MFKPYAPAWPQRVQTAWKWVQKNGRVDMISPARRGFFSVLAFFLLVAYVGGGCTGGGSGSTPLPTDEATNDDDGVNGGMRELVPMRV